MILYKTCPTNIISYPHQISQSLSILSSGELSRRLSTKIWAVSSVATAAASAPGHLAEVLRHLDMFRMLDGFGWMALIDKTCWLHLGYFRCFRWHEC